MIFAGIAWAIAASRLPGREPVRVYASAGKQETVKPADKAAKRNRRRKMRSKLK
jgi:hypothetical protein